MKKALLFLFSVAFAFSAGAQCPQPLDSINSQDCVTATLIVSNPSATWHYLLLSDKTTETHYGTWYQGTFSFPIDSTHQYSFQTMDVCSLDTSPMSIQQNYTPACILPVISNIIVAPNPSSRNIQVSFTSSVSSPAHIRIHDINHNGRIVESEHRHIYPGTNSIQFHLRNGTYAAEIAVGGQSFSSQLIIIH